MNFIKINIDGRDYDSDATGPEDLSANDMLFDAVEKDWGRLTEFLLDMAELWMTAKQRSSCQICYNHGNGAIAIGKYGMHPNTPDPYEFDEDEEEESFGLGNDVTDEFIHEIP